MIAARVALFAAAAVILAGCGAGVAPEGTLPPLSGPNVQPLSVNLGPTSNYANGVFTSVQLCYPGSTSTCQTIDNILVDTGSYGLRVLGSALTITLAAQGSGVGRTTGECTPFVDGYTWGPVDLADVYIAGEVAHDVPVNVIGASNFPAAPCTNPGSAENTPDALEANGILGVGPFQYDCGSACAGSASPGMYWSCSSSCYAVTQPLADQVQNPVALFSTDNNGVVVELPAIPLSGQATASGYLIFGIGTQSNNILSSALIVYADAAGEFETEFNSTAYPDSFIDSGSNALFFSSTMAACSPAGFYCPGSTEALSATMVGNDGGTVTIPFYVANAEALFNANSGVDAAFNDLAAPGSNLSGAFDWGLPFFYGRSVFVAIDGAVTPWGTGPYFAF